jgi:hypothetical protein
MVNTPWKHEEERNSERAEIIKKIKSVGLFSEDFNYESIFN